MSTLDEATLRDAMQAAINASTTLWYGTEETVTPGKVIMCAGNPQLVSPPFVIVHLDDVPHLPAGARHLREYAPTRAELAAAPLSFVPERYEPPMGYGAHRRWQP